MMGPRECILCLIWSPEYYEELFLPRLGTDALLSMICVFFLTRRRATVSLWPVCCSCCSCPFMERKLQGLKVLADAVTASEAAMPPLASAGSQGNSPALTPQVCLFRWVAADGPSKS